jgi:hypothetical protein
MTSVKTTFDRYLPFMKRSFALRAFNQCETEINRHFWSFKVISEYSRYIAAQEKKSDPEKLTSIVFKAGGPDADRIPRTVTNWLEAREELENWLRLSALVSATSYFEQYIGRIARSALMSDPLRRFGAPRVLDGIVLLKASKELPYNLDVEELTRGEWNSRLADFFRLFGGNPLTGAHVSQLERIRKIRNKFAHGFGRDLTVPPPSTILMEAAERLSHEVFLKYLGLISKCAALIDKFLLEEIIGNFELLHLFHTWKSIPREPKEKNYNTARAFQRALNRELGGTINLEFCESLIAFYEAL